VIRPVSATADLWLNAIDDDLAEGEETVIVRMLAPVDLQIPRCLPSSQPIWSVIRPRRTRSSATTTRSPTNHPRPPSSARRRRRDRGAGDAPDLCPGTDADGWVASVEFFADGVSLGAVRRPRLSTSVRFVDFHPSLTRPGRCSTFVWANPPAGIHVLKAVATDNARSRWRIGSRDDHNSRGRVANRRDRHRHGSVGGRTGPDGTVDPLPDTATFTIRRTGDLSILYRSISS